MTCFLETDIRKQQKYEQRIQASVDNALNYLCHENCKKDKNNFFKENTMHRNNCNDLHQLSFTLKISIFLEAYI